PLMQRSRNISNSPQSRKIETPFLAQRSRSSSAVPTLEGDTSHKTAASIFSRSKSSELGLQEQSSDPFTTSRMACCRLPIPIIVFVVIPWFFCDQNPNGCFPVLINGFVSCLKSCP